MELIKAVQLYKLHGPFYEEAAVGKVFFCGCFVFKPFFV